MKQSQISSEEITKRQNALSFKTIDIDEIEVINYDGNMVDIEVEDDHTFYVSNEGSDFVLTHNTSWPDIDTDAGDRDALIDASRELFGDDAVIPVSNFNTLKLKSLIKDISKFYGVPFDEVNKMTGPLQDEVMPHAKDENQEKSVFVLKHEDCLKYSPGYKTFMEKYPEVGKHVETLFMENRSIGRHAGGVIIGPPEELAKTMPIIGVRGDLQTPWTEGMNFRNLEDNGFLKFDFLGLTLLKDVENCIRRILVKDGNKSPTFADIKGFFDEKLNCRFNEQNDPEVWKHVYHDGKFTGVFQFTACLSSSSMITMSDGSIKSIADVREGEHVISYNTETCTFETKEVEAFMDQGVKECLELTLENGKTIECTYDHKFFTTNRGWVEAQHLDETDDIVEYL